MKVLSDNVLYGLALPKLQMPPRHIGEHLGGLAVEAGVEGSKAPFKKPPYLTSALSIHLPAIAQSASASASLAQKKGE